MLVRAIRSGSHVQWNVVVAVGPEFVEAPIQCIARIGWPLTDELDHLLDGEFGIIRRDRFAGRAFGFGALEVFSLVRIREGDFATDDGASPAFFKLADGEDAGEDGFLLVVPRALVAVLTARCSDGHEPIERNARHHNLSERTHCAQVAFREREIDPCTLVD